LLVLVLVLVLVLLLLVGGCVSLCVLRVAERPELVKKESAGGLEEEGLGEGGREGGREAGEGGGGG